MLWMCPSVWFELFIHNATRAAMLRNEIKLVLESAHGWKFRDAPPVRCTCSSPCKRGRTTPYVLVKVGSEWKVRRA